MENKNILAEQYKAAEHEMNTDPVETYKVMEEGVVEGYKVIEEIVVDAYKTVEQAVVNAFTAEAEPVEVDASTEAYKVMDRDTASDVADAAELGAETIVKTMSEAVVEAYKTIEEDVVCAYKKIEEGAVDAYRKVEDKFVEKFFARDGESVEDAKKRLQGR